MNFSSDLIWTFIFVWTFSFWHGSVLIILVLETFSLEEQNTTV